MKTIDTDMLMQTPRNNAVFRRLCPDACFIVVMSP